MVHKLGERRIIYLSFKEDDWMIRDLFYEGFACKVGE